VSGYQSAGNQIVGLDNVLYYNAYHSLASGSDALFGINEVGKHIRVFKLLVTSQTGTGAWIIRAPGAAYYFTHSVQYTSNFWADFGLTPVIINPISSDLQIEAAGVAITVTVNMWYELVLP